MVPVLTQQPLIPHDPGIDAPHVLLTARPVRGPAVGLVEAPSGVVGFEHPQDRPPIARDPDARGHHRPLKGLAPARPLALSHKTTEGPASCRALDTAATAEAALRLPTSSLTCRACRRHRRLRLPSPEPRPRWPRW